MRIRTAQKVFGKLEGQKRAWETDVDRRIILKLILKKCGLKI